MEQGSTPAPADRRRPARVRFAGARLDEGGRISDKTVSRMRWYLYALDEFARADINIVSSREIADKIGVKSGLVRKDLCQFGGFGRPSVGYSVGYLQKKIREILRVNQTKNVAWIGAERLLDEPDLLRNLAANNCEVVAVFDSDPAKLGVRIGSLQVLGMGEIEQVIENLAAEMAVIAISEDDPQELADRLVASGVKAILNVTPAVLVVPSGVAVRNIDLASELLTLSYYCGEASRADSPADLPGSEAHVDCG